MTITREVQSGMEVFAVDTDEAKDVCDKCALSAEATNNPSFCSDAACSRVERPDNREVYFLPQDDLHAQALFHSQGAAMTITKEVQLGMEVFAIDDPNDDVHGICNKCYLDDFCNGDVTCSSRQRTDGRNVHFLPVTDLKTQILFHTQTPDDGA